MQGKHKRVMPLHWLVKLAAMTSYDIQASPLARPSLDSSLAPQAQHQPFLSSPTRRQTEAGPVVDRPTMPDVPCVVLRRVTLDGREALPSWVPLQRLANQALGQCLDARRIARLMTLLQNRLIEHGWVTTRIVAPPQDLRQGELTLRIVPGRVRQVVSAPGNTSGVNLNTALPGRRGNVLDLRAIEQALDNLQRLSSVTASVALRPGSAPGESDIVIARRQNRFCQLVGWLDNGAAHHDGRYRTGLMLALDNPAALSDRLSLAVSRTFSIGGRRQVGNITGHYSVPMGYWLLGIGASDSRSQQRVTCQRRHYCYAGHQRNLDLQLAWVLHRNRTAKTTVSGGGLLSQSHHRLNQVTLHPQTRRTGTWRLGISHRRYLHPAALEVVVNYRRGTRWFGPRATGQEMTRRAGQATARPGGEETDFAAGEDTLTLDAWVQRAFTLARQTVTFSARYRYQASAAPQAVQDAFAVDGRWALRGVDAGMPLTASRGWMLHPTLAWRTAIPQQEVYLSAGYGEVRDGGGGRGKARWRCLAGAALGVRGHLSRAKLSYDVSAELPLATSTTGAAPVSLGFSLTWHY